VGWLVVLFALMRVQEVCSAVQVSSAWHFRSFEPLQVLVLMFQVGCKVVHKLHNALFARLVAGLAGWLAYGASWFVTVFHHFLIYCHCC